MSALNLYGSKEQAAFGALQQLMGDPTTAGSELKFSVRPEPGVGEIHIPVFNTKKAPRSTLFGRDALIDGAAATLRTSPRARLVLHGESGAGKTVAAIAVAYEGLSTYPLQLFFQASSPLVFRGELARYARAHVGGLPDDADEGALVAAAQQRLAALSGLLLIVDDVGPDLDGVLALLPEKDGGGPSGPILLTMQVIRHIDYRCIKTNRCLSSLACHNTK